MGGRLELLRLQHGAGGDVVWRVSTTSIALCSSGAFAAASIAALIVARPSLNCCCQAVRTPFLDTYRTMCVAPEPTFRRLLEEIGALALAS